MAEKRTPKGTWAKGTSGNPEGKQPKYRLDGWESAMTLIGSSADKRKTHDFCPALLPYEKCIEIYEGDDLGQKAAEMPIKDAFRQGYEISISDEGDFEGLKEDIEDKMREHNVDGVIKKALIQKRVLGGAAVLIGARDNKTMDKPLNRKTLSEIEFLTNLEPRDLIPFKYYEDPLAPKFGEVELWQLRVFPNFSPTWGIQVVKSAATPEQAKSIYIHESRLIMFNQDRVSKYTTSFNSEGIYWGLSIYTLIYEILRDFNISWAAAGILVTDFAQPVFSIENLMMLVARDPDGLRARMQAMNMARSVARAVLVDTKESFKRETPNIAGLSDIMTQISRRMMSAIGVPLSVVMGTAERTATPEVDGELRYYYDGLSCMQRDEIGPHLRMFAEIFMRGLRQRKLPKKWGIKWHPLWQLTDEQKANARLAQARVDAIYVQYGVLDPQVVALARFGGEYSFDTALPTDYEAPGFMAIAPTGVLVDGMDPTTGLPPGVQPPPTDGSSGAGGTGAHGVGGYTRRNPRQTSHKGTDPTAGGAVAGRGQAQRDGAHVAGCCCIPCLDSALSQENK
jgi:phage-related protein (TIGR01555 family)